MADQRIENVAEAAGKAKDSSPEVYSSLIFLSSPVHPPSSPKHKEGTAD
jgi:hypothetical protein